MVSLKGILGISSLEVFLNRLFIKGLGHILSIWYVMELLVLIHADPRLVMSLQIIGDRYVWQATFIMRVLLLILEIRSVEILNVHEAGLRLGISVNILLNGRFAVKNCVTAAVSGWLLVRIKQIGSSAVCPTL